MRCLIRFLSRSHSGALETRDRVFDGDALTLGRATDQVLHLKDRRVALEHARLVRRDRHLVIEALTTAGVLLNGAAIREGRVAPGDVLQVGANLLRIIEPPADAPEVDFALTFELDPEARADEAVPPPAPRRLADTGLGMRGWSWLLFLAVLAGALLVPASGLYDTDWQQRLRELPLPDDRLWQSGPLADVHQVVNARCEACHQQPFVQVQDAACLDCHAATLRQHAEDLDEVLAMVSRGGCTDCHREHDGSTWLVRTDDALCADCHRDIRTVAGAARVHRPATDFLREHPEFRVTTLGLVASPGATGPYPDWRHETRRELPGGDFAESSGLKFPHDVHLRVDGIEAPLGNVVLACADCHQPEPGGARFAPVSMQAHCMDCHRLDFDPAFPERQVPHGPASAVLTHLLEYYARRYLEEFADPLATARPAAGQRRPGPPLTAAQRAAALERARAETATVARDLVERRSCVHCHEVTVNEDAPLERRWEVRPVLLTAAWMPAARFSHQSHGTSLTPCTTCHLAGESGSATDILMPVLDDCRACHAGSSPPRGAMNLLASGCATCHSFHQEAAPPWHRAGMEITAWPLAGHGKAGR